MKHEAVASAPVARQRPARWVTGRRARVLLCASGVSFMIMLDSNIVAVSLPSIARDLNATFADIEWVVSAYVLTFAALLMPSGALADRFGRRRMLIVGLAIFTLASLLCGLAPSALVLNAARALQGVGAAIELSAALAVLGHEFRGAERAKAFGFWGTVVGVAVAVGPLVGGLITSGFGWRWAFLVNIPVGAALIWLAIDAVEEFSRSRRAETGHCGHALVRRRPLLSHLGADRRQSHRLVSGNDAREAFGVRDLACAVRRSRADPEAADGRLRALSQAHVPRRELRHARLRLRRSGHDDLSAALFAERVWPEPCRGRPWHAALRAAAVCLPTDRRVSFEPAYRAAIF